MRKLKIIQTCSEFEEHEGEMIVTEEEYEKLSEVPLGCTWCREKIEEL